MKAEQRQREVWWLEEPLRARSVNHKQAAEIAKGEGMVRGGKTSKPWWHTTSSKATYQ